MSLGVKLCSLPNLLKTPGKHLREFWRQANEKKCAGIRDADCFCLIGFSLTTGYFLKQMNTKIQETAKTSKFIFPTNSKVKPYPILWGQIARPKYVAGHGPGSEVFKKTNKPNT